MTRYVFESPEQMFDWIDRSAKKLLSISRAEFGKIELNISYTDKTGNWGWIISPKDKQQWKDRFDEERRIR